VRYVPQSQVVDDSGVYCRLLRAEAARRGMAELPFVSIPEGPEAGSFAEALAAIQALL
jgi:hypothetical protein